MFRAGCSTWWSDPVRFNHGLLVTLLLASAGCGYTLGPAPTTTARADARTIAVPLLDNGTTEPLLGQIVSQRLKRQLEVAGPWRIVNAGDRPDWSLSGRVNGLQVTPMAFDADSRATEYRIELRVSLTLTRAADGAVLWSAPDLRGTADYYASRDAIATRRSKERSLHDASQHLADMVAQQLSLSLDALGAAAAAPPPAGTKTP